jgi:serine/threonine protein kinase
MADSMIGTSLGPYRIVAKLGAGGMGEVFRASDSRLGRDVAVKILPAKFASDPDRLRLFEREARAAGSLNHPTLLTIFDIGNHESGPYLVSELLEGETLRERLRHGALPVERALDYAIQIARGLAAAHARGVVHRDLKPENLFVCKDGRVKILDFGLAKLTHPEPPAADDVTTTRTQTILTETGAVFGTIDYMSPEQVRGQHVDQRVDLFAFGAVLYEMLSGKFAFHGSTGADTVSAILNQDPPPLGQIRSEISPVLQRIVHRCLQKDPDQRFFSAADVAIDLEDSRTVSGSESPRGLSRKQRALVGAAIALALLGTNPLSFWVGRRVAPTHVPQFQRLTYRRGFVGSARFAPDGQTIVYSAAWDSRPIELFSMRSGSPESRPMGLGTAELLSMSSAGELALSLRPPTSSFFSRRGTLARVALAGGGVRELLEEVDYADWTPDGKDLLVVRTVGGKVRLELPIGHVLYETTAGWISHPRISPNGELVAFLDHPSSSGGDDGVLDVVDRGGKLRTLSIKWGSVEGLAWRPDGDEIWFSASSTGSSRAVYAIDLSGKQRIVYRAPGGVTLQDVFRDGRALVSRDSYRWEVRCLPPGASEEHDLSWLDGTYPADLSADGRTLLFTEIAEGASATFATYIRNTDGSPAVRLGEGFGGGLSADGKWAFVLLGSPPTRYALLPTGAGSPRPVELGSIEVSLGLFRVATWTPDGQTIVLTGHEPGRPDRVHALELQTGKLRPITPEGVSANYATQLSPDGEFVAAVDSTRRIWLYPVRGGPPRLVPGALRQGEAIVAVCSDGRSLFTNRWSDEKGQAVLPQEIYVVDIATGTKRPWKNLMPSDPTRYGPINLPLLTPDGQSYVYTYTGWLSELYLAEGLR